MNFVRPIPGASTGHSFPVMPAAPVYWIKKLWNFFFSKIIGTIRVVYL